MKSRRNKPKTAQARRRANHSYPLATLWMLMAMLTTWVRADDVSYTVSGGKVVITGPACPNPVLVVPQYINGLPVTEVGRYAFSGGCGTLGSIALPDNMMSIDEGAFAGCGNLTNI